MDAEKRIDLKWHRLGGRRISYYFRTFHLTSSDVDVCDAVISRVMQKVCAWAFGILKSSPKIFVAQGCTACYKRILLWLGVTHLLAPWRGHQESSELQTGDVVTPEPTPNASLAEGSW